MVLAVHEGYRRGYLALRHFDDSRDALLRERKHALRYRAGEAVRNRRREREFVLHDAAPPRDHPRVRRLGLHAPDLGLGRERRRGYRRAVEQRAAARRDELGELGRTLNDASARIQRQLAQLSAEADAKQALVDDLSHEMRTPLTAIGGYAQTIRLADLRGEELMQAAESIEFESRRLLNLSQQLLRLSVLHHEPLELTQVAAGRLMQRAVQAVAPKAAARGVTLTASPDPAGLAAPVLCQPDLMESLLVNLCDNGVKACAPGGQVALRFAARPGGWSFAVQDTGRGMDADTLARLGRPFYRPDKARSRAEGGAGLGVALCFAIARAHGAVLTYRSRPGQGTTVLVTKDAEGGPS